MKAIQVAIIASAVLLAACEKSPESPQAEAPGHVEPAGDHAHEGHDAHGDHALKPLMLQLGKDMVALNEALWVDDFDGIAKAATAVSDHPHIGPTEKSRIKKILGPDMANFGKYDKRVHGAASNLAAAARKKDMTTVLSELSTVQTGCVSCHGEFRERLKTP